MFQGVRNIIKSQNPPIHTTKVNVDAAIRGDFSVLAAVLHNHLGDMIVWNVKKIGVCPLKGEMRAAMYGLQEAHKL